MTILRGDLSPQPSGASDTPAAALRERRRYRLLALVSGSAMALMATPALAASRGAPVADSASISLPYAPLIALQAADNATTTPPAATPAPDAPAPAPTPTASPAPNTAQPPAPPAASAPPAATPPAAPPPADTTQPPQHGGEHEIVVSGKNKAPPGDPLIGVNLKSYAVVQAADKAVVGPAAMAYKKHLPSPLRQGLHNVLLNMREPPVIAAYLVEHKVGKAFETLGRLVINTTLGVGGIFDIAKRKPFHLPWHANGMADAMGFYGIKPGPYFFLPLIGPTTLRDLIGTTIDRVGFPALYADELRSPAYGFSVTIIGGLDDRVTIDPQVREFREHSPDPYAAMKTFYLTRRQAEIDALHGKPPLVDKPSDYDIPGSKPAAGDAAAPAATPPATPPVAAPAQPVATPVPATTVSPAPAPTADATPPAPQPSTPPASPDVPRP